MNSLIASRVKKGSGYNLSVFGTQLNVNAEKVQAILQSLVTADYIHIYGSTGMNWQIAIERRAYLLVFLLKWHKESQALQSPDFFKPPQHIQIAAIEKMEETKKPKKPKNKLRMATHKSGVPFVLKMPSGEQWDLQGKIPSLAIKEYPTQKINTAFVRFLANNFKAYFDRFPLWIKTTTHNLVEAAYFARWIEPDSLELLQYETSLKGLERHLIVVTRSA